MGPLKPSFRRLALARPGDHPLSECVRAAGWTPVAYSCTTMSPTPEPPPPGPWDAVLILSPAGARAIRSQLPGGTPCLVTGAGTAEALKGWDLLPTLPAEPRAEGLWSELQARFPSGGAFLLVRGERSRAFLEAAAEGSPWHLTPWLSHGEIPLDPVPPLPSVEGVLALSPLQAEVLAPLSRDILRFAWGERSAQAFASVGFPATAWCQPSPSALEILLRSV
ncbi:uroporphyrinogen-III synthase [Holophaga foetida]|uniref:uroporphyrinogen-III synthase n=1 Tax=Holophaga foetida TaxID=35839 RepID=UPI0002473B04|nr:uroporphyrinogen-III synthase [Holophaga foetida]